VVEVRRGAQEARGEERQLPRRVGVEWDEGVPDHALDPPDVHHVEGEGSSTGLVHALRAVAIAQAQELLGLAEVGPGEGSGQEPLCEAPDVVALAVGLADQVLGIPHGVGGPLRGVVGVVRGALSLCDSFVRGDDLALDVDPRELRVATDPDLPAHVSGWRRVEGLLELDVVVGVDLALLPHGRVKAFALEREQRWLLHLLEDGEGALSGGAVGPLSGGLEAPAHGLALDMVAVQPRLTPEEALPDVGYLSFDVRLAGRVLRNRGVDHEVSVTGVLGEGALEDGVVAIGLGDGGLEVVDDYTARNSAKEDPGVLESLDQIRDLLREGRMDVLVTAVDQRDDERVEDPMTLNLGIPHAAEPSEVHLGELTRRHLGHAHGDPAAIMEAALLDRKAVERAVGDLHALAVQQRVDLGQTQAPGVVLRLEPAPDLRPERGQPGHALPGRGPLRHWPPALGCVPLLVDFQRSLPSRRVDLKL
jgi:hypothetical protein